MLGKLKRLIGEWELKNNGFFFNRSWTITCTYYNVRTGTFKVLKWLKRKGENKCIGMLKKEDGV